MELERPLWQRVATFWLPVFLWMALIFVMSSQPKASMPHNPNNILDWLIKKSAHLLEYGILALLVWRAISGSAGTAIKRSQIWLIPLICVLYAATDEYHQSFVDGRSSKVLDVFIDGLGVSLALIGMSLILRWRAKRPSRFFVHPRLARFFDGFFPLSPIAQENVPK